MTLDTITAELAAATDALSFAPPVTHVYNPLVYAHESHRCYLERFGRGQREIVLVGMNPGPFGMAQTGVPFGDVTLVRDWMGIEKPVGKPPVEHPKRPVLGFACPRSEVSGARLWGWARDRYKTPEAFFARFFVLNYCPLCFMEATGRNRTPDKLPAETRALLFQACDRALAAFVAEWQPSCVLGVGAFAELRIREALAGASVQMGRIPHPSPANPAANRGWATAAEEAFHEMGIAL